MVIKKSNISGKGVFADKSYKKDEIVLKWDLSDELNYEEFNLLDDFEKSYVSKIRGKYYLLKEPERYVNHSCLANTRIKNFCDVAIRDIKKGEEITGNYNENKSVGFSLNCNCGSKDCCGKLEL